MKRILHGLVILLLGVLSALAQAQDYPSCPVRMIIPFDPGGASDFVARIIAPKLGEALGQQIVIDDRSGAAGNIGVEAAGRASADGHTILLGGEVSATMLTVASFIPHVKSGRLKVLAVVSPNRVPQLPDVPTMIESGFPKLTLGSWQGVYVPAGTPRPVVNKLYATVIKVMADPEMIERYRLGGALVVTSRSLEDFAAFMKIQTGFWSVLVNQLGAVEDR